jgi:hypothetical protein
MQEFVRLVIKLRKNQCSRRPPMLAFIRDAIREDRMQLGASWFAQPEAPASSSRRGVLTGAAFGPPRPFFQIARMKRGGPQAAPSIISRSADDAQ